MTQNPEIRPIRPLRQASVGGDPRLAAPTPEEERAIDDFVVARIGHYFEAIDAGEAFGRERLARLERERRIVVCGDRYDAYYARVPR